MQPISLLPPKIISLEQRTPEWHAWRRGEDLIDGGPRITASMLPQIIGVSPWGDANDLWMELTGRKPPKSSNFAMQRGIDLEPRAREAYTNETGIQVNDTCIEHPNISWAAASLDGLSLFADTIVEIKVPGQEDHQAALFGRVPEKYIPQLQWQLFCCPTAKENDYWSFDHKQGGGVLVKVLRDGDYQDFLFRMAAHFRECVINDTPPCGDEYAKLSREIRELYRSKQDIEEAYKVATSKIVKLLPNYSKSVSFAGVSVSRVDATKGRIDYDALLAHLLIPAETVELFRKKQKDTGSFRVSVNLDAIVPRLAGEITTPTPVVDTEAELAW